MYVHRFDDRYPRIHEILDKRALVVVPKGAMEAVNALIARYEIVVESATDSERGVVMRLARVTDAFIRRLVEVGEEI